MATNHYEHELWGCRVRFDFPTVKLLDFQPILEALEANDNPFAALVIAHLQSQATRDNPAQRLAWKTRLFRGLLQRKLTNEEIRQLLRIVDWFLELPPVVERQFRHELRTWREEQQMPFIPSFERFARDEGAREALLSGIEALLEVRFNAAGLALLSEVGEIDDVEKLRMLQRALRTVKTPEEFETLLRS